MGSIINVILSKHVRVERDCEYSIIILCNWAITDFSNVEKKHSII